MNNDFFALISRMRYIQRWSLMRNSIQENVQEHSHMVAVIAHALGVISRDVFGKDCDPDACAAVALFHDASEILTGDLPTPIKYHDSEITGAYRKVEALACEKLLNMLPEELRHAYEPILTGETEKRCHAVVKAADKLSAEKQTLSAIRDYALPEADYFLEHFIPAFEKTLDELGSME